jgi:hypothetical protein
LVADATHAHVAGAVVVSSGAALVVSVSLHAHAATEVDLDSWAAITVLDAAHQHLAQNVAVFVTVLTPPLILTSADSRQPVAMADQRTVAMADQRNYVLSADGRP